MYIEFHSDRHHEKQGFDAEFEFLDEHGLVSPPNGKYTSIVDKLYTTVWRDRHSQI